MSFPCDQFSVPFYELTGDLELDRRNLRANWMEIERAIRNCTGSGPAPVAPFIVDSDTFPVTGSFDATGIDTPIPSPTHEGQVMLAFIWGATHTGAPDPEVTIPSGWNVLYERPNETGPNDRAFAGIYWRVATDSEPGTYPWTGNNTDPAANMSGIILQLSANANIAAATVDGCGWQITGTPPDVSCPGCGSNRGELPAVGVPAAPALNLSMHSSSMFSTGVVAPDRPDEFEIVVIVPTNIGHRIAQRVITTTGSSGTICWPAQSSNGVQSSRCGINLVIPSL